MSEIDVVRVWKDLKYRRSLTPRQLSRLPSNPAGDIGLSDDQMQVASGLKGEARHVTTAWFCTLYTFLARCCP